MIYDGMVLLQHTIAVITEQCSRSKRYHDAGVGYNATNAIIYPIRPSKLIIFSLPLQEPVLI